jgi:hypothetical protein
MEREMAKGIDLTRTASLIGFNDMLVEVINEYKAKQLTIPVENDDYNWKFQIGYSVNFENAAKEPVSFWIGYGWNEQGPRRDCLWLEFQASTCPRVEWEKLEALAHAPANQQTLRTCEIDEEFSQTYMDCWIHFRVTDKRLKFFYDETTPLREQKGILTEFMDEVLSQI